MKIYEDQLAVDQDLKEQLNDQKETLLEYAKEKIDKQKEVDDKIQQAELDRQNSTQQVLFAQQ